MRPEGSTDAGDADLEDGQVDGEQLVQFPPDSWELVFRKPVTFAGTTYNSVVLREPTGEEWERIFAQPEALRRRFGIHVVGGIPMGATAHMGIGDLVQGEEYLHAFFRVGEVRGAFWQS